MEKIIDIEESLNYILNTIESSITSNEELRNFLLEIIVDSKDSMRMCIASPNHHNYAGGLIVHIASVLELSMDVVKKFAKLDLDVNLVIAIAILHDIGKTVDLLSEKEEKMTGHQFNSMLMAAKYMDKHDISEEYKKQILHGIKVHMNDVNTTFGGMTMNMVEAYLVHQMDGIDAYLGSVADSYPITSLGGIVKSTSFPSTIYKSVRK